MHLVNIADILLYESRISLIQILAGLMDRLESLLNHFVIVGEPIFVLFYLSSTFLCHATSSSVVMLVITLNSFLHLLHLFVLIRKQQS